MLGLGCGVVSWIDQFRTPRWRPYRAAMFVGLGASGVVPMLHGLQMYGYKDMNERMSLSLVVLQGLIYMFGAFLYAVCPFPSRISVPFHTHPLFVSAPVFVGFNLTDLGPLAREDVPRKVRHLGKFPPDLPRLRPPRRRDPLLRDGARLRLPSHHHGLSVPLTAGLVFGCCNIFSAWMIEFVVS